jgi:hypothetical protein
VLLHRRKRLKKGRRKKQKEKKRRRKKQKEKRRKKRNQKQRNRHHLLLQSCSKWICIVWVVQRRFGDLLSNAKVFPSFAVRKEIKRKLPFDP